jgi:hypothetical protein
MKALVLFKGTGSIDAALEKQGWSVTSLDILPKFQPTFAEDIMTWNYRQFEPGHFAFIWASPVCTEFSRALTTRPRVIELGDRLAKKALEIVDYFKPKWWALENPQTGLLKTRPYMQGLPYQDVCYCMYGYPYRKATRIWGNVPFAARPMCNKDNRCDAWLGTCLTQNGLPVKRHLATSQRGPSRRYPMDVAYSQKELYSIPPELCQDIVAALE